MSDSTTVLVLEKRIVIENDENLYNHGYGRWYYEGCYDASSIDRLASAAFMLGKYNAGCADIRIRPMLKGEYKLYREEIGDYVE